MVFPRVPRLVSVVIPSFNQGRYAEACLDSLASQTYKNIELIWVDDCSNDETWQTLRKWKHARRSGGDESLITLVKLPRHIGYAGALTVGFFLASGEYIALQDADDLSASNRFVEQVEWLESRQLDIVGTNLEQFEDGQFEERKSVDWIEYGEAIKDSCTLGRPFMCTSTALFKGIFFDYVGGLRRSVVGMEMTDFISRCITNGAVLDNIPSVLYYARKHPNQRVEWIKTTLTLGTYGDTR